MAEHHLPAQQRLVTPFFTLLFELVLRDACIELQNQFYRSGDAVAINRFGQGPVDVTEPVNRPVGAAPKADVLQGDQDVVEIGVGIITKLALLNLEKKTCFGWLMSGVTQGFGRLCWLRRIAGHRIVAGIAFVGGAFLRLEFVD